LRVEQRGGGQAHPNRGGGNTDSLTPFRHKVAVPRAARGTPSKPEPGTILGSKRRASTIWALWLESLAKIGPGKTTAMGGDRSAGKGLF